MSKEYWDARIEEAKWWISTTKSDVPLTKDEKSLGDQRLDYLRMMSDNEAID